MRRKQTPPAARYFTSAQSFRGWLSRHHATKTELLVGLYKRGSRGRGLSYIEALDEALAYGWIDGVRKSVDAERWTIRFTPRRPGSVWSHVNTRRAQALIASGRMAPPGLRAFEARREKRTGVYTYENDPKTLDATCARTLDAHPPARAFLEAQPPGYRRLVTGWIMNAKREDTRLRRLQYLIRTSSKGRRIDFMKPLRDD